MLYAKHFAQHDHEDLVSVLHIEVVVFNHCLTHAQLLINLFPHSSRVIFFSCCSNLGHSILQLDMWLLGGPRRTTISCITYWSLRQHDISTHCFFEENNMFCKFLAIFQLIIYYMLVSWNSERLILVKSGTRLALNVNPSNWMAINQLVLKLYVHTCFCKCRNKFN